MSEPENKKSEQTVKHDVGHLMATLAVYIATDDLTPIEEREDSHSYLRLARDLQRIYEARKHNE